MKNKGSSKLLIGIVLVLVLIVTTFVSGCGTRAPTPSPTSKPPVAAPTVKPAVPPPTVKPAVPAPTPARPASPAPAARAPVQVNLMTSPTGGLVFTIALATADVAKKQHPWLKLTAAETPGYIYNMEFLGANPALWDRTIIGSDEYTSFLANKGQQPFKTQVLGTKRLLGFITSGIFYATLDSNIKTVPDLAGKRLALGNPTQIGYYIVPNAIFDKGYGILDKIKVSTTGSGGAISALTDGLVDAAVVSIHYIGRTDTWVPDGNTTQLINSGKNVNWIGYTNEALEKTVKATGIPVRPTLLRAGKVKFATQDVITHNTKHVWIVKDVFPEDLAYEFVKLHLANYKDFWKYHKIAESYSTELFTEGLNKTNTHPGALRAYEEFGVKIPDK